MSYQSAKRTTLTDKEALFSGGYVDNTDNFSLAPQFSPYLRNARLDGQSVYIRPGHILFKELTAGSYPKGIGLYLRPVVADQRLIVRHNTDSTHKLVLLDEDANATSILTNSDITSDNRMFFQTNADVVYCMNGVDPMGTLSGTTYTVYAGGILGMTVAPVSGTLVKGEIVTGGTSAAQGLLWNKNGNRLVISVGTGGFTPGETITGGTSGATATITTLHQFAPAFSAIFNGAMWVSGWEFAPNLVFKSAADNYIEFTFAGGGDLFVFQETVTGLSGSSQAIFYYTPNTLAVTGQNDIQETSTGAVSYITRPIQTAEGSASNACAVEVGSNVYYLSSSNSINKIVAGQSVYGFEVTELSDRKYAGISKIMGSLDKDQSSAFAYLLPQEMLIKRFLKTEGATFNDICIIYDITRDKFLVDTQKYFYGGIYMPTWGKNYTISNVEAKVFRDEYSQDDDDSPTPFEYRTKEFFFDDPIVKKILRESHTLLDINELAELYQTIRIDGVQRDEKVLFGTDVAMIGGGGIGTESIGDFTIGDDGDDDGGDDDYFETYILRTKGDLNKKGMKIQRRFTNETIAGKVRLKQITTKIEVLPPIATNLTP